MVQLRAGLNQNLVRLRCRSFFYIDHFADIQTGWINSVLSRRHHVIADFHLLESRDVAHLDYADAEIRTAAYRTERARLAQLSDHRARPGLLVRNQHYLRRPRTDGDHTAHDPAASPDRHIDRDAGSAAAIDRDRVEPDRRIASDHARRNAVGFGLFAEVEQGFETFVFRCRLTCGIELELRLRQPIFQLLVFLRGAAEVPD